MKKIPSHNQFLASLFSNPGVNHSSSQGSGAAPQSGVATEAGQSFLPSTDGFSNALDQRYNNLLQMFSGNQWGAQPQTFTPADPALNQSLQNQMLAAQMSVPTPAEPKAEKSTFDLGFTGPKASTEVGKNWLPNLWITMPQNKSSQSERKGWGTTKDDDGKTKSFGPASPYGVGNTLLGAEAYLAEGLKYNVNESGNWGSFKSQGVTRIGEARGRIYNNMGWDPTKGEFGLGLGAQAQLNLIRATYDAKYQLPEMNVGGANLAPTFSTKVDGFVGAQGDIGANLTLGKKPNLKIGAGGFAGASASISGGVEAGGVGVSGSAKGWAGIGAKAELFAGMKDDGKFHLGFDVGAALGVGGSLSWGISIDPKKVVNTIKGIGKAAATFGKDVANTVAKSAKTVAKKVTNVAKSVGKGISNAAKSVGSAVKKVFSGW